MITPENIRTISEKNKKGLSFGEISRVTSSYISSAIPAMENLLKNKKIQDLLKKQAPGLLKNSPWIDSGFGLYFATVANMKTTFAPRAMPIIDSAYGSSWSNPTEIGSGAGIIEPWKGAIQLLQLGLADPGLMISYDSPGGRYPSRWAAATILNSQISSEVALKDPVFTYKDTYITPSSTAAIDTVFDAFAQLVETEQNKKRVVILGPSYYVLPLSAVDKKLPVTRISKAKDISFNRRAFFPTIEQLKNELPEDTGMLVLTLPNNPNGEIYDNEQLKQIFQLAKNRDFLVLIDQVFEQLNFDSENKPNPINAALDAEAIDKLIVVDALSKSQNIAGIRLGWLVTKNQELERAINKKSISRLSNPSLTVEPLLQFEAMARILDSMFKNRSNEPSREEINLAIELVRKDLGEITGNEWLNVSLFTLTEWYRERRDWIDQTMQYYKDNLALIQYLLDKDTRKIIRSPDEAAYNTFIGFDETGQNSGFDKILKLFLLTGIVAMSGQCFGQLNPENEFWTRITYGGLSRDRIPEAMSRLSVFFDLWEKLQLGNSEKYPVISTEFKII